jgi:hypothetical protein
MEPVTEIFKAFGDSPTKLARATGLKVQTVCDWRRKGKAHIPLWRRAAVLAAAKSDEKVMAKLSPDALLYLAERDGIAA